MNERDVSQEDIINRIEGMVLVDAGPGTGKTRTLVRRYVNLLEKVDDLSTRDILMLTFTNNAAAEMELKIKKAVSEKKGPEQAEMVMAKTFDSLCYSIVLDSAEEVGRFFGIEEKLTRSAKLSVNDSVNRQFFQRFFDGFILDHPGEYGDIPAITAKSSGDVFRIINRLMTKGIVPLRNGWFGYGWERELRGDASELTERLMDINLPGSRGGKSELLNKFNKTLESDTFEAPIPDDSVNYVVESTVHDAAYAIEDSDDTHLEDFIHDVYRAYIRHSIINNTLTYSLNAIFALTLLYDKPKVREHNAYRFVMIDEFQDTNNTQMMISLMLLTEPNMCCVGDWKQGIYGFRDVSIYNIEHFEETVTEMRRFLNDDVERVPFQIPDIFSRPLERNYRSSDLIIGTAFKALKSKAVDKDVVDPNIDIRIGKVLETKNGDFDGHTHVRFVESESLDDECSQVVRAINDYMENKEYLICNWNDAKGEYDTRRVELGDIAILCTKRESCRAVKKALDDAKIPAFLQGDVEIMGTREGKMCLAWLKYVNNPNDPAGYVPIMADLGYNMVEIGKAKEGLIPESIITQRSDLVTKMRRMNDLLSALFSFYPDFDQDIVQAIINALTEVHKGSLQTISGMITMIQDDLENHTAYPVEATIDSKAVKIMTMHKSKGLEFSIVIIPFMDKDITPMKTINDRSKLYQSPITGLRCTDEVGIFTDGEDRTYPKICKSWKTSLVKKVEKRSYDEDRRLLFVAMSRARQYETLICGKHKESGEADYSQFMKELSGEAYDIIPEYKFDPLKESNVLCKKPVIPEYRPRRIRMGVHDIMDLDFSTDGETFSDEVCPKGARYGTEVHDDAAMLFSGRNPRDEKPEHDEIRRVLADTSDADMRFSEVRCTLPVDEFNVVLNGVIDLLVVYPDHIEIHDYKTDSEMSDAIDFEYRLQLSVYAHAASAYYGLPARCFLDYVSLRKVVEFDPMDMDCVKGRVFSVMARRSE